MEIIIGHQLGTAEMQNVGMNAAPGQIGPQLIGPANGLWKCLRLGDGRQITCGGNSNTGKRQGAIEIGAHWLESFRLLCVACGLHRLPYELENSAPIVAIVLSLDKGVM